jgi:thiamine biosynthesis lipoprotein
MKRAHLSLAACLLAAALAVGGLPPQASLARFEFTQAHMGTRFKIILYAKDSETATLASNLAFERIARLDATMSDYRETSELMRLSKRAGEGWIRVSDDLFRVLARSQQLARRTLGAFDVTVGPLVRLWRRARRTEALPERLRLKRAREVTGYRWLHLDRKTHSVRLDKKGMILDLGGIAKGYAADEAIAVLKRAGIRSALVAAGGDIVAGDPPPAASAWTVAIAPLESSAEPPTRFLALTNAAVSTSGDAEQYAEIGGARYSHILDPRTGRALTGHSSVTVVARSGMESDSLATAASVLGPKRGLKLIDQTPGAAALFIQGSGNQIHAFESKHWKSVPISRPEKM